MGLPIGMNLDFVNYYTPSLPFTDAMKSCGAMFTYPHGTWNIWNSAQIDKIPKDRNGWPTQIPYEVEGVQQDVRFMLNSLYDGEYVVLYDGVGTITFGGVTPTVIDGKQHINLPGIKTNISLNITSSTYGNHIRNMRIIPVSYLANETTMPTFQPEYISGLKTFYALRFMDFTQTNNNTIKEWAERNTKETYTQGNGRGVAWEHIIDLSNQLSTDAWICIPHQASDDYLVNLATLLKNSLNSDKKIYLEFSNELWNWQFQQAGYVLNNATGHPNPYVSADLAAIGAAGVNHPEKDAYMMARTFRLFAQVFGDDMNTRVVRVATGQAAWTDNSRRILKYLFETNGIGADALAVGGYFGFNDTDHAIWNAMNPAEVTPEMILQSGVTYFPTHTAKYARDSAAYAKQYGVKYLVYEGGQHMQPYNQQDWAYNHAVYDAQVHPGMYELYMTNFALHQEPVVDCQLFMAYSYIGPRVTKYGSWGHLENAQQLSSPVTLKVTAPKFKALLDVNRAK
jgi:hypothetical protein